MDGAFIQSFDVATGESITVSMTCAELEWKPIEPSQNDLDFMEHQQYIAWKIAGIFGLSLQDLGVEPSTSAESGLELHPYKNICCGEEFDPRGAVREPITDEGRLLT